MTILLLVPRSSVWSQGATPDELRNSLATWIENERKIKNIPSISIALVDDQKIAYSSSFGYADPASKMMATPDSPYRVGSVSKPFTAVLLMIFVELGLIDLDVPVQQYLPEFQPTNKSGKQITLRQMLSHRSGVVREGPVGNYFDDTQPTLEATIASLNKTELVFEPGSTTSYSNMALATVGYVLERTQKEDFSKLIQRKLLDPIGMTSSSFRLTPEIHRRLPKSVMWSYHGREFPAPEWDFGILPAGNLFSSVNDQAKFLQFLFAEGRGVNGPILKKETLESMYKIQFPKKDEKAGFGLGFFISDADGKRVVRHGGAVYGFSTEFAAMPDDKVGVIVCASKDVTNAVTTRIAMTALKHLQTLKAGKPLPKLENSLPLEPELARSMAGRYRSGDKEIECYERGGKLWIYPHRAGMKIEVRKLGSDLITDDLHSFGLKIVAKEGKLTLGKDVYEPIVSEKPQPLPQKWAGLLGEFGPDFNILVILERQGQLHALIEWQFLYPLKEISEDVYQFPDYGLYLGDKIRFFRDKAGVATHADAASVYFKRRPLPRLDETFKLDPIRGFSELLEDALASKPPIEKNELLRKPDLVDLTTLDKTIKLDIRYATDNNFLGKAVYRQAKAYLQRPAAEALAKAHLELADQGYGLMIHDAYRPWYVTKLFREATPPKFHLFVADPAQGSRHNRGCAVDLTLYDLKTGKAVEMVGGYDEMTDRSYPDYQGGSSLQRWHRDLLRRTMEKQNFQVYEAEWWHFDFQAWRQYPILNLRFEELGRVE